MTDSDLRERRGSHRARRNALVALAPTLLSLAAVAALVVAVVVWRGADPADVATAAAPGSTSAATPSAGSTPGGVPPAAAPSAATTAVPAEPTPADSTPADSTPADSTPADSTPADSTPADSTPADSTPTPPRPMPRSSGTADGQGGSAPGAGAQGSAQVVVLNQTAVRGLAGRVAATLRSAGWRVSGTGNFHGTVPVTTVYYPSGMADMAAAVAADISGPDRVKPRFGNLSTSSLTVVLANVPG